jgi:hypothetical protein
LDLLTELAKNRQPDRVEVPRAVREFVPPPD